MKILNTPVTTTEITKIIKEIYLIDSVLNTSMKNDRSIRHDYIELKKPIKVTSIRGETSDDYEKGKLMFNCQPKIEIDNVLYVHAITKTQIATNSLTEQGLNVMISDQVTVNEKKGRTVIQ